jgi:uncharacterized membrane protein
MLFSATEENVGLFFAAESAVAIAGFSSGN